MRKEMMSIVVALGVGAFAAPVMAAPSEQSKVCSAEATKQGLHGDARASFRAQCMKASAPAGAAASASGVKRVANTRMKSCAADWKAAKAAGQVPAGQTWPKYWSACNKRLAAG
jgi:hypothetical protein